MDFHYHPRLLQLFDSALPNGGYAHSQGLEGLVQGGEITDEQSLVDFLRHDYADTLTQVELPLLAEAHRQSERANWPGLTPLDELSWALRPTRELRQAGNATGRQTFLLFTRILPAGSYELAALHAAGEHFLHYQAPIVIGTLAAIFGIPLAIAMTAYANQLLSGVLQPTIKLLQFGPSQVQRLHFTIGGDVPSWVERALRVEPDGIGTVAPRWDIASARHEFAERRLFIS